MGLDDKIEAKVDQATGKAKEGFGDLTDNEDLQAEGRGQAANDDLKEGWEDTKDAAESGWEKVKDAARDAS